MAAKLRDSSILLLSAIARTMSGRLCIARPERRSRARRPLRPPGWTRSSGSRSRLRAPGVAARVGVDGQEQVRAFAIGDGGSLLERHEHIRVARHDDFDARLLASRFSSRSATSSVSSDSLTPFLCAPGSWPPCPASITIRAMPRPSCRERENLPSVLVAAGGMDDGAGRAGPSRVLFSQRRIDLLRRRGRRGGHDWRRRSGQRLWFRRHGSGRGGCTSSAFDIHDNAVKGS